MVSILIIVLIFEHDVSMLFKLELLLEVVDFDAEYHIKIQLEPIFEL